ncbi:DUF6049 family protein [Thermomonospora amylolytica]|uniref:DUF6049 family protein n=1 Tax=Thermomonospora amylolytica TaxID=1411117 RepID=UPI0022775829|nr:DUF6049 family protein [Thermomonospora amylolytica]
MDGYGLRVWRRAAVVAVLSSCVIAVPAPAPQRYASASANSPESAAPPAAAPRQAQTPLELVLTDMSERTVTPRTNLTIKGHVVNRSGRPLTGVHYRFRYLPQRMSSRGQLAQAAKWNVGSLPGLTAPKPLGNGTVPAGNTPVPWQLTVRAGNLGLRDFGAYPIGVEFFNAAGQQLAGQVTFMVWRPPTGRYQRTSIGWVWPVTDRTRRTTDHSFLDDGLDRELAPTGRLGGVVTAAEKTGTPLTWAVDPALLDDAQAMTRPYTVRPPHRDPAGRPASQNARTWLDRFKKTSAGDPYFVLPYADVDAEALVRNGMGRQLEISYKHMDLARQVLGRPPAAKVGWPAEGAASTRTLGRMAQLGTESFLMSSALFQPAQTTFTPGSPTTVRTSAGQRNVVTYDPVLSDVVSAGTRTPGTRLLAEQRFLAETAMITAELPLQGRTIVIAPARRWNPDPLFAENLLRWTQELPWLRPARVDRIAQARRREPMTFTGYPSAYQAQELGRTYLREVKRIAGRAGTFSTVFQPAAWPYERAVLRTVSGSWRGGGTRARRARAARDLFGDLLDKEIDKVRVSRRGDTVQLAGRTGRVPFTITNGLPDRTVRLQVKITSRIPARLQIGEYTRTIEVGPNESPSIDFEVESYAQGAALVDIELLTPQGKPFRPAHTLRINTTGYGPVALLITGGSLAVLFVGVGFRAMRARRRNKMEAAGDGSPGGEPPWPDEPADPAEHPAERSADS